MVDVLFEPVFSVETSSILPSISKEAESLNAMLTLLVAANFSETSRNLSKFKVGRFLSDFWDKLTSKLLKNTQGCFTMREEVAESYMLNGNGVQKELFLTQPNFLIMPKINLNLLRKLASLVT